MLSFGFEVRRFSSQWLERKSALRRAVMKGSRGCLAKPGLRRLELGILWRGVGGGTSGGQGNW